MNLYDTVIITKDIPAKHIQAGTVGVIVGIARGRQAWAYIIELEDHPDDVVDVEPPYVKPYKEDISQLQPMGNKKGDETEIPTDTVHDWWNHIFDRPFDPGDPPIPDVKEEELFEWIMRDLKRRALEAKSLGIPIPQHIQDVTGVTDDGKR